MWKSPVLHDLILKMVFTIDEESVSDLYDQILGAQAALQGRPPLSNYFLTRNANAAKRGAAFNAGYAAVALSL